MTAVRNVIPFLHRDEPFSTCEIHGTVSNTTTTAACSTCSRPQKDGGGVRNPYSY